MTEDEMIDIAKIAIRKRMDYETLKYCDYMYGKESLTEQVYEYVEECDRIGREAFYTKYPDKK